MTRLSAEKFTKLCWDLADHLDPDTFEQLVVPVIEHMAAVHGWDYLAVLEANKRAWTSGA